jgi:hypothetical protein
VKKLLAMTLVAGLLGFTTGCPSSDTPTKKDTGKALTTGAEKAKAGAEKSADKAKDSADKAKDSADKAKDSADKAKDAAAPPAPKKDAAPPK